MEKIKSFTVDHTKLLPGVYLSREDAAGGQPVTTYDIRLTRPNFEPVMGTGEIHTIEHIGATYLRNRADVKDRVIYWGPMGCRTGFYLILAGAPALSEVERLMRDLFAFTAAFEGAIPGATPVECGNYSDMDLPAAKARAAKYGAILEAGKAAEKEALNKEVGQLSNSNEYHPIQDDLKEEQQIEEMKINPQVGP